MNKLYHLHIPRTSGTGILYAMHKSFYVDRRNKGIETNRKETPGIFEFVYDHEKMGDWPVVSGHFAINPILVNGGSLETFSIVRNPVDHFVSVAAYRAMSSRKEFSNSVLDRFLEGRHETTFGCKLFSSSGNLQAKMLTCRIVGIDETLELTESDKSKFPGSGGAWFVESDFPKSEKELIDRVSQIKMFQITQREKINNYLKYQFKYKFNVEFLGISPDKTNSSVRNGVTPSPSQEKEILERNSMDLILYEHVCSGESRNEQF